jgi:hypothetical protein
MLTSKALLTALCLVFVVAGGCARTTLPVPTPGDAQRAGSSMRDLERGRALYQARCSSCHLPVQPASVPAHEWPAHVHEMSVRAHLDASEEQLVIQYLVTMSDAGAQAAR